MKYEIRIGFIIGILTMISILTNAQIKVIDSLTQESISGVNLYADNGSLLGATNIVGEVMLDSLKQEKTVNLTFQHVAFSSLTVPFSEVKTVGKIKMVPRSIKIDEVAIGDRSKADYVVLKGYFRNLALLNNKMGYFVDGIVTYYIPLKNKKEKVRFILKEYRIFENKGATQDLAEKMGTFFSYNPSLINLKSTSIAYQLPKGFRLEEDKGRRFIKQGSTNMGFVQVSNEGKGLVYLNRVVPGTVIDQRIFKIQARQHSGVTIETYAHVKSGNLAMDHLVSVVRSAVTSVKKKNQTEYMPIETYDEFYVLEKEYISTDQYTEYKKQFAKSIFLKGSSNYQSAYWNDLDRYGISALPKGVKDRLGNTLKIKE
ncbi:MULTISPECIES: hypothetical protein [unclassified Sphingobacterium]|uniref:hypothetical protein n=1 Tax=unclassified Sphingobacterium TaxID=2609468 RepID=UPI0025F13D07|nr:MULTISPECIES: hypothetical protein [unclassified Sphingobacterium]